MQKHRYRVCIIGAGAAGCVLAKELTEKGVPIILLEAGKLWDPMKDYWEESRYKYYVDRTLEPYSTGPNGFSLSRVRGVGGQTIVYNNVSLRYSKFDFKIKTHKGVGEDWPISYEELEPYYTRVERDLGVSGGNENLEDLPSGDYLPPLQPNIGERILAKVCNKLGINIIPTRKTILTRPYMNRPSCIYCTRCSLGCRIRAKGQVDHTHIPKALATKKCDLRTEVMVKEVRINRQGKVKDVIYIDKITGKRIKVKADVIVLSAGAIESPRILLNSQSSLFPYGLVNNNRLVGKYLMENTLMGLNGILPIKSISKRSPWGIGTGDNTIIPEFYKEGFQFQTGMEKNPLPSIAKALSGFGKSHKDEMRRLFTDHVSVSLAGFGEILPNKENREEIDHQLKDYWGIPAPKIYMGIGDYEKGIITKMLHKAHQIFKAAGSERTFETITRYIPGIVVHQVGTCRMGNDPATSVVNKYCQTHEVKNLFVVDGSCFVTCPSKNPALTIQALAARSADYIIQEAERGNL